MAAAEPRVVHGHVHSVESAGTLDGPGVRFVVFLGGCPLSCSYCHNPDCRQLTTSQIVFSAALLAEISAYRPYLRHTRGGMTISGGEPLMQPAFTEALLHGCRLMGLHTALDTSGFLGADIPDSLLDVTDLVLLDIKSGLPHTHEAVTGVPLRPILDFARRLEARGQAAWVRFVLVPGITDGIDNIRAVASIVANLSNVRRLEVLPFHKMGEHKWEAMGRRYDLRDTPPPDAAAMEAARLVFREAGIARVS
jgi:pyruvate formate lyase activating enzyme